MGKQESNSLDTRSIIRLFESPAYKAILILGTFLVALFLAGLVAGLFSQAAAYSLEEFASGSLLYGLFFPLGLLALLERTGLVSFLDENSIFILWGMYLALSLAIINIQKPRIAIVLYLVMVLVLLANVRGCTAAAG